MCVSFIQRLRLSAELAKQEASIKRSGRPLPDRWPIIIERLQGRPAPDGGEWIATRDVFEELGIPECARPSFSRCVAGLMRKAGWTPTLVGPRHARCRGYYRFSAKI